jgi:hypothetical protein
VTAQRGEAGAVYTDGTYWADKMDAESKYKVRLVCELMLRIGHEWPRKAKIAEVGIGISEEFECSTTSLQMTRHGGHISMLADLQRCH